MRTQPGRMLTTKRCEVRPWRLTVRPWRKNPASHNQSTIQPTDQRKGATAIGTVATHQRNSRRNLYRAHSNLASGKVGPASSHIQRSASHAVTAAALHWDWGFRTYTKRRLTNALRSVVRENGLPPGHLVTFAEVYSCTPQRLAAGDRREALRILTRLHRRVRHLADDIDRIIAEHPNPPTLDQVVAQIQAQPPPPPSPTMSTLGELYNIFGRPLDSQYEDHPLDCPDCNRLRCDPTTRGSIIFSLSCPPCVAAIQTRTLVLSLSKDHPEPP